MLLIWIRIFNGIFRTTLTDAKVRNINHLNVKTFQVS